MKSTEIRNRFLQFFARHGHEVVASSPLVPANDQSLLFTNAGMVQFKDVFLGRDRRPYTRAASAQRCLRAGGKHNDLENVGYTARHHTFFEMLGNFSFGDYFKRDAIRYAWEFLTGEMGLPADRLWVTVFEGDDEAARIWLDEIGVDAARFSRIGEADNFWSMGDTGPCGPCSEIFYDHGPGIAGGPPGSPEADGDRYVEIWNLVFMQFDRDREGRLNPLPKPSVDTGMGLERMAAVMQKVTSNYDIDLFQGLIRAVGEVLDLSDLRDKSLNVIADHIRAAAFLVTDGVVPGNEGRGYVLRRIVRRALRHGHRLGATDPFFYRLVAPLIREMGEAYPELARDQAHVEAVLKQEEERFAETLSQGLRLLEQDIAGLEAGGVIPGATVFRLYDTYGFPADLTADIARERGLSIDMVGFEREMTAQRNRARAAQSFRGDEVVVAGETEFCGYEEVSVPVRVRALAAGGRTVPWLSPGEEGVVFLDRTPFYAESGGQVGDQGLLEGHGARFVVEDTRKGFAHIGRMAEGTLRVGDELTAIVSASRRIATAAHHSATHLLHAALRRVLGTHVTQRGSLVGPERLRFDFSHSQAVSADEIVAIEQSVNEAIRANSEVAIAYMALSDAVSGGAMALFGEKYGEQVRVVAMGGYSTELCGGTHVSRTGDIGFFKIVSETAVGSGVRRIEAVTGAAALDYVRVLEMRVNEAAQALGATREDLVDKALRMKARVEALEKEIEQARARAGLAASRNLAAEAVEQGGVKTLVGRLDGDVKGLREAMDRLKGELRPAAILLASIAGGRVTLMAGVTPDVVTRVNAVDLVNEAARVLGGKGGGRPEMAQAGGPDTGAVDQALEAAREFLRSRFA
ncbi:alanine--tRNA ligase [Acidiferrobacter thiooxydans]|uniref:alanine--tRNA ligase n=1 Tax=Acidiferrobacter thiooxydans TaxID=163359 RepID=UPI000824A25C|nr:alanine--tRNA ligase [Acidiferrobacter thiooxydans]UEO00807.1 alanine--tRNA ligase [Acidiferrobacter thiooxydans]